MIQPKLIRYEMTELGSNFEVRPNFGDPNCHVWPSGRHSKLSSPASSRNRFWPIQKIDLTDRQAEEVPH